MRGRGLKPQLEEQRFYAPNVAPHAGAWIETMVLLGRSRLWVVAPHAGAWIETLPYLLVRVGLLVAPHAGAWIETFNIRLLAGQTKSRPPCGGVD